MHAPMILPDNAAAHSPTILNRNFPTNVVVDMDMHDIGHACWQRNRASRCRIEECEASEGQARVNRNQASGALRLHRLGNTSCDALLFFPPPPLFLRPEISMGGVEWS